MKITWAETLRHPLKARNPKERCMERWTRRVADLLDGAPTRALPLSRLIQTLKEDGLAEAGRREWILARLTEQRACFKVIPDRLGPWVPRPRAGVVGKISSPPTGSGLDPWIMTCSPGRPLSGLDGQVMGRIRESLQAWGREVDDGSQTAVARWIGANHEAARALEAFFRPESSRAQRPPSTNRPPRRLPRTRIHPRPQLKEPKPFPRGESRW